jgi:uncharacterized protein YbjT (DUF2867 family)
LFLDRPQVEISARERLRALRYLSKQIRETERLPSQVESGGIMAAKKVVAVVGATGAQGGGVANAILEDSRSEFTVRAITRKPDSEKGKALSARGADVVRADIEDVDSLAGAFAGAYAAFLVTNFWEHFSPDRELAQAHNLAEAAKRAGVRHVVWSTLEDVRTFVPLNDDRIPTLMGKYKVPHFDAKGEADTRFKELGVPTTFLVASFYWDNFVYFGSGPKRGQDGVLALTLPLGNGRLAGIAAEDIGKCAYGIFREGSKLIGQTIGIAGEHLTGQEMARKMGRALGEEVRYQDIPAATFRSLGFPGAEDLGNMFWFYTEYEREVNGLRSVERTRQLNPELLSFDAWLAKYASRIPVEATAG